MLTISKKRKKKKKCSRLGHGKTNLASNNSTKINLFIYFYLLLLLLLRNCEDEDKVDLQQVNQVP